MYDNRDKIRDAARRITAIMYHDVAYFVKIFGLDAPTRCHLATENTEGEFFCRRWTQINADQRTEIG